MRNLALSLLLLSACTQQESTLTVDVGAPIAFSFDAWITSTNPEIDSWGNVSVENDPNTQPENWTLVLPNEFLDMASTPETVFEDGPLPYDYPFFVDADKEGSEYSWVMYIQSYIEGSTVTQSCASSFESGGYVHVNISSTGLNCLQEISEGFENYGPSIPRSNPFDAKQK